MSLFDDASLVMIPSAYKDGKLYSIKPTDGSGDFTFSRATAATRVNADGLIEKETQNLFTYSNTFDNAIWAGAATWTSGQADKDGGTSAWTFAKFAAASSDYYNDTTINGVQTFSIYAKKQTGVGLKPYFFGSSNGWATFNLEDGSVFNTNGSIIIDTNVETYNSQWWRISVTINASSGNWYLYVTDGTDTQTSDVITLQDAQLEQGLVARDYIETTTAAVYGGITDNVPRLDYTDSSCPALKLEPQRTNLLTHSEYFGDWTNIEGNTITANATESPEGLQNAYSFIANTTENYHRISSGYSVTLGQSYTSSVFVKANGYDYFLFRIGGINGFFRNAAFDLTDGTTSYLDSEFDSSSIVDYGNGWYKVSATFTATLTGAMTTNIRFQPTDQNDSGIAQFTGDGTSGGYIYGAQVEEGSYATSYIPCYGTSQTRSLDVPSLASLQSNDIFGSTQGTALVEFSPLENFYIFDYHVNSVKYIRLYYDASSEELRVRDTIASQWYFTYLSLPKEQNSKVLLRWDNTTLTAFVNGSKAATDYTLTETIAIDYLEDLKTNKVKQILFFPTALTDSECIELTAL